MIEARRVSDARPTDCCRPANDSSTGSRARNQHRQPGTRESRPTPISAIGGAVAEVVAVTVADLAMLRPAARRRLPLRVGLDRGRPAVGGRGARRARLAPVWQTQSERATHGCTGRRRTTRTRPAARRAGEQPLSRGRFAPREPRFSVPVASSCVSPGTTTAARTRDAVAQRTPTSGRDGGAGHGLRARSLRRSSPRRLTRR